MTIAAPPAAQHRSARQRIIETALKLFYAEGIRAVGIDRIIAESGVAKMSFYRHFPSKTDLVCTFLEARHERWMTWFQNRFAALTDKRPGKAAAKLPLIADVLREWFASKDFHGCAFINILAETTRADTRQRAIARQHKEDLLAFIEAVARQDGIPRPHALARRALMIVEGAIVRAEMTGDGSAAAADCRQLLLALSQHND